MFTGRHLSARWAVRSVRVLALHLHRVLKTWLIVRLALAGVLLFGPPGQFRQSFFSFATSVWAIMLVEIVMALTQRRSGGTYLLYAVGVNRVRKVAAEVATLVALEGACQLCSIFI